MRITATLLIAVALIGLAQAEEDYEHEPNYAYNARQRREIFESMDRDNKPCSNFYEYACGNWFANHGAGSRSYDSVIEMINYEVNTELIQFMENTRMTDKPEFVKKAHAFYTSCGVEYEFKTLPYVKWLEEHEGHKSALLSSSQDVQAKFDWVHTLAIMRKHNLNGVFINELLKPKDGFGSPVIVEISKFKNENGLYTLSNYEVEELNKTFSHPPGVKHMAEYYEEIYEFENLLAKLDEIKETEHDSKVIAVKDLPFAWLKKYLEIVLNQKSLDPNMEIYLSDLHYLESLDALLKEYDDVFLSRYLEVKFLMNYYWAYKRGSSMDCIRHTRGLMPMAMHWIYEQLHPELEQEVAVVIEIYEKTLNEIKKTLHSDKSGLIAPASIEKLDKLHFKVGNLPRPETVQILESFYGNLTLSYSDYYGNQMRLLEFYFDNYHEQSTYSEIKNIQHFFNVTEDYQSGMGIHPIYLETSHVIIVPFELLRSPIYHWGYDRFFKQSSLGTIIGQYIYSALDSDNLGKSNMEQIAQIGSIHASYEIIFSDKPENLNKSKFIGKMMDMPLEQVFFLNAAQYYCENYANPGILNNILSKLGIFSSTYDCQLNSFLKVFKSNM
ncbi:membrane metallo-endopeptidase-like 1 [Haematobia irritans]|uniref:membrane metallo-endopeptidase-like 1 n=1 Tax=Haematobia irritans TaxID=7368 RepID=UPI003F50054C